MLDVIKTSFYIKAAAFDRDDFARYSTALFDEWDNYVEAHLGLPDYAVTLVIEEGSIKGLGIIATRVGILYLAIGNYGSFISGVQTIRAQASQVTNALFDQAKHRFGCNSTRGNSKQSGGEIFYLKNLFERVQRGKLSPDQAVVEIRDRWGQEAATSPNFLQDLASSLAQAPQHPQQIPMSGEFWEPCAGITTPERTPKRKIPHAPEVPIPQQYRIEISRSRKGGSKKVTLTKVE